MKGRILYAWALISLLLLCLPASRAQQPSAAQEAQKKPEVPAEKEDPFADLTAPPKPQDPGKPTELSWRAKFFKENFGFRKEVMAQFNTNEEGKAASRQSVGFEVLKKFSTATRTVASFNMQGRLVRRDGFNPVLNDMEGANRQGWAFEYHNLYLDLYNVFHPFMKESERGKTLGRFNLRAGRFYVPFGLNLQTDTHGTVLQLSNDRNFGFERDWYTGLWGSLNRHLNYDVYYLAGSGYDLKYQGQAGLGALRISLANRYSTEYGWEGGVSFLGGERLSPHANERQPSAAMRVADRSVPVETRRAGVDGRYRRAVPTGLLTFTNELSGGRDAAHQVFTELHQAEYTHSSRRWGVASQYQRFREEKLGADSSLIGEFTWYFKNDVGNSSLHWIKLNVERQLERMAGSPMTIITLQYYFYR